MQNKHQITQKKSHFRVKGGYKTKNKVALHFYFLYKNISSKKFLQCTP